MRAVFQKDSLGWQLEQLTQRINEWIEARWNASNPPSPDIDLPQWHISEWFVKGFFWALLGGLLGWCLWKSFPTLQRLWYQWLPQTLRRSSSSRSFSKPQPPQYWLLQSKILARQSNYPEACRALYFALLQWLHDQDLISQSASRTDGEYLQLLPQVLISPSQADSTAIVIHLHQELCFSSKSLNQEDFLQCHTAIQTLKLGETRNQNDRF
jgi:hypothetical protein